MYVLCLATLQEVVEERFIMSQNTRKERKGGKEEEEEVCEKRVKHIEHDD